MSQHTSIEWADSTVNESMGCSGCELWNPAKGVRTCYAGVLTERYAGRKGYPKTFDEVTHFPGQMAAACAWKDLTGSERKDKPWLNGLPRVIFVDDMGDVLDKRRTLDEVIDCVMRPVASAMGSRHWWLMLTKRAKRLPALEKRMKELGIRWPENLGVGVSITGERTVGRARYLKEISPALTFWSVEPLWGELAPARGLLPDWVIVGGASGANAEATELMHLRMFAAYVQRWRRALFVKQLGSRVLRLGGEELRLNDAKGARWDEWPDCCSALHVREMPEKIRATAQLGLPVEA